MRSSKAWVKWLAWAAHWTCSAFTVPQASQWARRIRYCKVDHHPYQVEVAPPADTTVLQAACLATAFPAANRHPVRADIHGKTEAIEMVFTDNGGLGGEGGSE